MSENNWSLEKKLGRIVSKIVDERVKTAVIADILIEKGFITEDELVERYEKKFSEKKDSYSADILGLSLEEYKELIK